jgi:hypothetical protein
MLTALGSGDEIGAVGGLVERWVGADKSLVVVTWTKAREWKKRLLLSKSSNYT